MYIDATIIYNKIYTSIMDESTYISFLEGIQESPETASMIKYFKNQIKFKRQTLHLQDKFKVVMSFIKFMKTICNISSPTIYGSFTRNIIEKLFIHTANIGYGDPLNHDIDILIYRNKYDYDADIQSFNDFISLMRIVSINQSFNFDFYGFKVVDVIENTVKHDDVTDVNGFVKKFMINIPHHTIILSKDDFKIKLDLIAYKSNDYDFDQWQNEFNINSLSMDSSGIIIKSNDLKSYDFFEIINSIMNKTAVCNMPFDTLLHGFNYKTRNQKTTIINQIIWFMINRFKILTLGYTDIYSDLKFFDYKIERDEQCVISGNEPPYISIRMECGHYISLMGLAGLINIRSSEWTESIKCPLCRKDINIVLIEKKPENILIPVQPTRDLVLIDKYEVESSLLSQENIDYINHLVRNGSLPITTESERVNVLPLPPDNIHERRQPVHNLVGRRTREEYFTLRH